MKSCVDDNISRICLPSVSNISLIPEQSGIRTRRSRGNNTKVDYTFGMPPTLSEFLTTFVPRKTVKKKGK